MVRALLTVARCLALIYLSLCAVLFFFQRSFIYFPQSKNDHCEGTTVRLEGASERVLVCTRPAEGERALIYFGGNAEDVSLNLPSFSTAFPDRAIYLLNYRGYGGSSGKPTQGGLFSDGLTLFDQAHSKYRNVEVVGRSLGSGVAVYVASLRPVARLILITPYNSIEELAVRQFRYLPVRWMLHDKYESWQFAPQVSAPTLIVAADNDEVVPRASTEGLRSHFRPGVASMVVLPGTGHNTISESSRYLPLLGSP